MSSVEVLEKILYADNTLDEVLQFQKEHEQAEDYSKAEESSERVPKNYKSPKTKGTPNGKKKYERNEFQRNSQVKVGSPTMALKRRGEISDLEEDHRYHCPSLPSLCPSILRKLKESAGSEGNSFTFTSKTEGKN